ncbi:MAG: SprT-like domain-containing protein [Candidatus Kapaibacterium sp.]
MKGINLSLFRRKAKPQQVIPEKSKAKPRKAKSDRVPTEMKLFREYVRALRRYGVPEEFIADHNLENELFWLFELSRFMELAQKTFDRVNTEYFSGQLSKPTIVFARRATGGFYNYRKQTIGISLSMTVEFGDSEFLETMLHEIAHIRIRAHNRAFYTLLRSIGGSGRKAPMTALLSTKRAVTEQKQKPVVVECPNCFTKHRFRTKRALRYACKTCCDSFSRGKFDTRFLFRLASA